LVMVQCIKALFQVTVHDDTIPGRIVRGTLFECRVGTPFGSETVAVRHRLRIDDGFDDLSDRLWDDTVPDHRDAAFAHTAIGFRYFHPLDGLWLIRPVEQFFFQRAVVGDHMAFHFVHTHAVDTRRPFVAPDGLNGFD